MTDVMTAAALARLLDAGASLRDQPAEARIRSLGRAVRVWQDRRIPERVQVERELTAVTGYSRPVVTAGLDRLFGVISEEALLAWWKRSRPDPAFQSSGLAAVVAAGNIPGIAIFPMIAGLLAGRPVLVKTSTREPVLTPAFAATLARLDPALGAACAVVTWKGGDEGREDSLLGRAERILAFGGEAAIASLMRRFPGRVAAYGPGLSIVVVGADASAQERSARAVALDLAIWDQQGCLSPHAVYVEGDFEPARRFGEMLAVALTEIEGDLPHGTIGVADAAQIRAARQDAEARAAAGNGTCLWTPESGLAWTVMAEPDPAFRPSCLHRTIRVHALPDLHRLPALLAPYRAYLQAAGTAVSDLDRPAVDRILHHAGFSFLTRAGTMQSPPIDWPNKGRDLLSDLAGAGFGAPAYPPGPPAGLPHISTGSADSPPAHAAPADGEPAHAAPADALIRSRVVPAPGFDDFRRFVAQTSDAPIGIEVAHASGCHIWDKAGRRYLDLIAGIGVASVGHSHPEVVQAIENQARRHLHVMVYGEYVQDAQVALARRLAAVLPGSLSVTYFTSSGAEAIEGSLKMARKFTGRTRFVAFEGGYHGDTMGALSLMAGPLYRKPFEPLVPGVTWLEWNERRSLERIDETVAAVVIEPVQGEGGVRIPSPGFLPALRRRCNAAGALLVFDEVITGFGRTGRLFGAQHWDVVPDIMVMAKALGGGMPLGGFASRPEIMATLATDPPLAHVTTFGGHPVSCAAGLAALEITLRDDLPERAARLGDAWRARLRGALDLPFVRDVRGLGLLVGIEFDDPDRTRAFVQGCFRNGLLLGWTLHRDTVVRLAPPLVITSEELEQAAEAMEKVARALP